MRSQREILQDIEKWLSTTAARAVGHLNYSPLGLRFDCPAAPAGLLADTKAAIIREQKTRAAVIPPFMKTISLYSERGMEEAVLIGATRGQHPTSPNTELESLLDLAFSHSEAGDTTAAIKAFRKASELDPQDRTATFQLAWHLSNNREFDEAIKLYWRLLNDDFLDEHVWCNLGGLMQALGFFPLGLFFADISLILDPKDEFAIQLRHRCGSQ